MQIGFYKEKKGFKVLMPKESEKTAKRIGYIVTTSVTSSLRKEKTGERYQILDISP